MTELKKEEFEIEANMLACTHSLDDLKYFMEKGKFIKKT